MKQQNIVDIDDFLISLDKLISSKYIVAERKISDVLISIAHSSSVYNLIAKTMINFDFQSEWKKATATHFFRLPETDEKRVAFIFCLLSNIDDHNIDFMNFIANYFSAANSYSAFELFSKTVLIEFKRLILKFLEVDENSGIDEQGAVSKQNNFDLLLFVVENLISKVKKQNKVKKSFMDKNEMLAVLSTFILTIKNKEIEYFYAFRVTLNSAISKNRVFKDDIEKINNLVDQIIRGIYE